MRVVGRTAPLPLVRTGLLSPGGLAVAGVIGVAFVLQRLRASRQRKFNKIARAKQQEVQVIADSLQLPSRDDDLRDWPTCGATVQPHEPHGDEIVLLTEELPLTCKQLWTLIYNNNFVQQFQNQIGNRECKIETWKTTGRQLQRQLQYVKPLKKNIFGPREAFTAEEFRCLQRGDGGFHVEVAAYTRQVPYGGSFHVKLHWTATPVKDGRTRLQVVGGIVFENRVLVAGTIRKATLEYFCLILNLYVRRFPNVPPFKPTMVIPQKGGPRIERPCAERKDCFALPGLQETFDAYRDYLWLNMKRGKLPKEAIPNSSARNTIQSVSTATKIAAEDLIKNGIFVSWGQVIGSLLFCWLLLLFLRLLWTRQGRLLSFDKWLDATAPGAAAIPFAV